MVSLTENQTSRKVAFLLPEIARCDSGVQSYLRKRATAYHLLTEKYQMLLSGAKQTQGLAQLPLGLELQSYLFMQLGPGGMEMSSG